MTFWNKLKGILLSLGIGGEITLFIGDSDPIWKVVAGAATFISILITQLIQDNNNNGKPDIFEKQPPNEG